MVVRDRPVDRATRETPPRPSDLASAAAHNRRIRSFMFPDSHSYFFRIAASLAFLSILPFYSTAPNCSGYFLTAPNTPGEVRRKLVEYFLAGTELVWIVDPVKRVVVVYTSPEGCTTLTEDDTLDGASVLPGITLPVRRVFEETEVVEKPPRRKRRAP